MNGAWVNQAPKPVHGHILERCTRIAIELTKLPGYWYTEKGKTFDARYKPSRTDKVVRTFHGASAFRRYHSKLVSCHSGEDSFFSQHIPQTHWPRSCTESSKSANTSVGSLYRISSFKMGYGRSYHTSLSYCSCGRYRGL